MGIRAEEEGWAYGAEGKMIRRWCIMDKWLTGSAIIGLGTAAGYLWWYGT
jgi:hypothetical protein